MKSGSHFERELASGRYQNPGELIEQFASSTSVNAANGDSIPQNR